MFLNKIGKVLFYTVITYVGLNAMAFIWILSLFMGYQARAVGHGPERVNLYGNKKDEYHARILEARNLFKIQPNIKDPFYAVAFGANFYNAFYQPSLKCVIVSEKMVRDFTIQELSAVIAHEFAHAEEAEMVGQDIRPHWQVDVRASELTEPKWMESALLRLEAQDMEFNKDLQWIKSNPRIFWLAIYMSISGAEDFPIRLEHVRKMKKK